MGVSGNSNVVKSFQSFMVNDGLLAKVVEAIKAGEKEARSTSDVQSFEVFYKGFRQNICIGRIYVVPPAICNDRKNFPVALLYGTVVREFHGEELADLTTNKIGDSEFDEYSKADFDRIKESLFGTGEGKFESIVLFAPSWTNVREYICFKFSKDDTKLTNLVRHLVFSAYYNPALSSGFDALMTEFNTSKLDITDVTPKLSYPGVTENPLTEFPNLTKQGSGKKKIFLTKKTADEITKEVLDPQELDVFESLDQALTNALMPETKGVEEASEAGEGGFTAPTQHEIPEVHVGAEKHKHKCPECKRTLTCNNPKDCPGEGKEALCGSCPANPKKKASAAHETPFTNVGPGTSAAEAQESMVDAVKETIESPKANPIEGKPIGIPVDEVGVPRREEEERKVATSKKADWDSFGHKSHPGNRTDQDIINNLKNYAWGSSAIPLDFGDRKAGVPRVKHASVRDELNDFERAYIEAALWSSNDDSTPQGGEPMDRNYDIEDISPEGMERIRKDCAEFQKAAAALLEEAYQRPGYDGHGEWSSEEQAAHDFWLTRNGHGAGFWDRNALDEGGLGDKLTEVAKRFGECDLYIGDDSMVHVASAKGAKLDASYIAHHLAEQVKDSSEPMSSKAKAARKQRETQLDKMRSQVGVTKRADVALTFDDIWDSATEDFGAAPEVKLPGEKDGESNPSLPAAMTSEEPEKAKAITEGDAKKEESAFENAAPAFEKKKEAPKAEEPKKEESKAPAFEKKKEEPKEEAKAPAFEKEEPKEEEKEEEPKEASSKQADTADNAVEIDNADQPTSQETGESPIVQQHKQYEKQADTAQRSTCPKCGGSGRNEEATRKMKEREPSLSGQVRCSYCNGNGWEPADGFNFHEKGADQKQAGKIQDRINELEAKIKPHLISVENGADVQLDDNGNVVDKPATCGNCGMTWNDALITDRTPTPSARCPYEYIHGEILELKKLKRRLHQGAAKEHGCRSCGKPTEYNFCSKECAKKNNEDMSKGDYASPEDMKARTAAKQRVHCDQCQMLSINGVPCHETGCPNSKSRWDAERQDWVRMVKCFECGEELPEDDAERHAEEHYTVEEEPLEDDGMDDEIEVEASVEQKCPACDSGIHGECANINPTQAKVCDCPCYVNQEHKVTSAMGDENAETVKMDFGMGDLADIVMTEDDETPVEGDDKEHGADKTAESKLCKQCHKNPVAPGTSSSLCKSCHEDSMAEAEKAQGVQ